MEEYGSPLPQSVRVRGHVIDRSPIGRMLKALERLNTIAPDFIRACFPNATPEQIKAGMFQGLGVDPIGVLVNVAPGFALDLVSELTLIPRETLENDPNIGLDGLAEILSAWAEVNNIVNFTRAGITLAWVVRGIPSGSIGSLLSRSKSESESENSLRITSLMRLAESFANTARLSAQVKNARAATSGTNL